MDMEPPRVGPSSRPAAGGIPRGPPTGATSSTTASSTGAGSGAGGSGGMSSKLSGLQRLKEASNARLANRIPSANGSRPSGEF